MSLQTVGHFGQVSFTLELTSFGPCCRQTERGAARIPEDHAISCMTTTSRGIALLQPSRLVPSLLREEDWRVRPLHSSRLTNRLGTRRRRYNGEGARLQSAPRHSARGSGDEYLRYGCSTRCNRDRWQGARSQLHLRSTTPCAGRDGDCSVVPIQASCRPLFGAI
jgi:hypothetical protein